MTITQPQPNTDQNVFQPAGDPYDVTLGTGIGGQELVATVVGDYNADGPSLWLIVPPLKESEDTGIGYELNEDQAVALGSAIYASLPDEGRLRLVTALGQDV